MSAQEYLVPPSKIVEYLTAGSNILLDDGSEVVELQVVSATGAFSLSLTFLDDTTGVLTTFAGWKSRIHRAKQINAATTSGIRIQVSYL